MLSFPFTINDQDRTSDLSTKIKKAMLGSINVESIHEIVPFIKLGSLQ